jgi:hypothetical protein
LKVAISGLPPEKILRVSDIIKERMANVDDGSGGDHLEVDLDTLDARTLHHLERYVKTCAPRKRKKAGAAGNSGGSLSAGNGGSGGGGGDGYFAQSAQGLPDVDMDLNSLEADVLDDDYLDVPVQNSKRSRPSSLDPMGVLDSLPFSQGDMPEGLDDDDEDDDDGV